MTGVRPALRAWPALAAAALTAVALAHALVPGNAWFYRDLGMLMHPALADAHAGGDMLAFWTHLSSDGRPILANPGNALLSPASALWRLVPHDAAFDLFLVLHAMLAAAGMALLARRLGASPVAQLLAGSLLGLGGGVVSALDLYWALVALGWAPWALLAGVHACETRGPRAIALLAVALALEASGGMPEVVLATLLVGGVLSLAVAQGSALRRIRAVALAWGVGGALALLLAAPQLLTAALTARTTVRGAGFTAEGALYNSLDPRALPGLIWPRWGGSPLERLTGGFPGAAWTDSGTPYLISCYLSSGAVLLALLAWRSRRRGVALALGGAALLGVAIALGRHLPGLAPLVDAIAPLPLRYPVKALFATFLAVPPLAALGLDALTQRMTPRRGRALALAIAGACCIDLLVAHRGMTPVIAAADLAEPPLALDLKARARALDVPDGQWRVHHQRFPDREWGPPPASLPPTEQALHAWQRRVLLPPTGMAFGIHHAFDRQPDQMEDLRHFEMARSLYQLEPEAWARELGATGVLFVVSPLPDLETTTRGLLLRLAEIGAGFGVPAGSAWLYRDIAFEPRVRFTGVAKGDASVEELVEDHAGLTLRVRCAREARLVVHDAIGDPSAWRASTSDGRPLGITCECPWAMMRVPAGEWTIRLRYEPLGWRAGLAASALGALGVVALTVAGRRRPARHP